MMERSGEWVPGRRAALLGTSSASTPALVETAGVRLPPGPLNQQQRGGAKNGAKNSRRPRSSTPLALMEADEPWGGGGAAGASTGASRPRTPCSQSSTTCTEYSALSFSRPVTPGMRGSASAGATTTGGAPVSQLPQPRDGTRPATPPLPAIGAAPAWSAGAGGGGGSAKANANGHLPMDPAAGAATASSAALRYEEMQKLRREVVYYRKRCKMLEQAGPLPATLRSKESQIIQAYAPPPSSVGGLGDYGGGGAYGPGMVVEGEDGTSDRRAAFDAELRRAVDAVRAECDAECEAVRRHCDERLRAATAQQNAAASSAEQQVAAKLERERTLRIELLQRQVARRILHSDLVRGWSSWHELWSARTYAMARLREVANRLHSPKLAAAFYFWASERAAAEHRAQQAALSNQARSLESQLRSSHFEVQTRHTRTQLSSAHASNQLRAHARYTRTYLLAGSALGAFARRVRLDHAHACACASAMCARVRGMCMVLAGCTWCAGGACAGGGGLRVVLTGGACVCVPMRTHRHTRTVCVSCASTTHPSTHSSSQPPRTLPSPPPSPLLLHTSARACIMTTGRPQRLSRLSSVSSPTLHLTYSDTSTSLSGGVHALATCSGGSAEADPHDT